jgi:amino acid adenylation domain-containing protein/thioester reductase-like protein
MKQFWTQFLEIVRHSPDNIAICEGDQSISYAGLAALAAGIGEELKSKGVTAEMPVALAFEKSINYIAALLGCWYAGAAFVPLPPSLPAARRDYILRHADIQYTLSDVDCVSNYTGAFYPAAVGADTLAYIIYTSGSTGAPKGVMVEHRGIVNFIDDQMKAFEVKQGSRYLFYLSILFDAALSDIGVCLLSGATLVIEPPAVLRDGARLVKRLQELQITHLDIPPSLLKTLPPLDMPDSLETIVIGGEICPPEVVRLWAQKFRIINVYGPTEATVCTSLCRCDAEQWDRPLLGTPLTGIEYYILDEEKNPAAEGELYIGGIALARGYLKQPELTAQKFIEYQGQRLYKTGDKVRRHDGGTIEFLGRIDRQFKLRGQLVEPDEVEARLVSHPAVKRAAVLKRDERLVSFIVADKNISAEVITVYLHAFLPVWMIPQHFEWMEVMPLTASGKIDYAVLKNLPLQIKVDNVFVPPSSAMERKLWAIWRTILKHDNFGIRDDFFSIGGDSLDIIRMTLEAERQGLPFIGAALAANRTIEKLALALGNEADCLGCDLLKQDVAFDAEWIDFFAAAQNRASEQVLIPQKIFLTGAAGFLGGRLLSELIQRTTADIYCLVRAKNTDEALSRIKQSVDRHAAKLSNDQLNRIKPLCGDLTAVNFGLDETVYTELADKIDSIYHCAAKVNMLQSFSDLRVPNIEAVQNVLRFACTGRRKHLHHASTLSVFVATDQNSGTLLESNRLENTRRVYGGYAQTKWAAEWLLLQVPKDACAVTHYRFGLITGDSKSGVCSDNDFLIMFVKGIASLRTIPKGYEDKLFIDITPVDYAAAAMAQLSLHGRHEIYHIANPQSLSLGGLTAAIERSGVVIKRLPAERWKAVVDHKSVTVEETAAGLSLCRCLPQTFEKNRTMDLFQATDVVFDMSRTESDLRAVPLSCSSPSDALLDIYLRFIFKDRKKLVKICIFGPESTGKSTLTEKLAEQYHTGFAAEFAKELIFAQDGHITLEDIPRIARGQIANEKAAAQTANSFLFCDTDLITTVIWSRHLFADCPEWIEDAATLQDFDLYFLMDIDTPWVADTHRFLPEGRETFLQKCRQALAERNIRYVKLTGGWEHKFATACDEINRLFSQIL